MDENKSSRGEQTLLQLYEKWAGHSPSSITKLEGAGSNRCYYRFTDLSGKTCIGAWGESVSEAYSFIHLSRVFSAHEVSVPHILAEDVSAGIYLQTDLGDESLFSLIKGAQRDDAGAFVSDNIGSMVSETMLGLASIQSIPPVEWRRAVGGRRFSGRRIMWDLNYFKYEMLKSAGMEFDEQLLEDDFEKLTSHLLALWPESEWGFMYRDCQSRNVMIHRGHPFWIDFQGGMEGPVLYDAVSFLWQARASFYDSFRRKMLEVWSEEYVTRQAESEGTVPKKPSAMLRGLDEMVLLRTLQVLGAYGFRGLVERKAHFIESIPRALDTLVGILDSGLLNRIGLPELEHACRALCETPRFASMREESKRNHLEIKVFSFSYKKGYPEDLSGNGGGFMFDCRGIHNPGRYPEYRNLTGMDEPVRMFLRENSDADDFVNKAVELVSTSVKVYLRRGFTSLQIGFGCTGGRHRSVYCAEATAGKLAERFPEAEILTIHREQNICKKPNRHLCSDDRVEKER